LSKDNSRPNCKPRCKHRLYYHYDLLVLWVVETWLNYTAEVSVISVPGFMILFVISWHTFLSLHLWTGSASLAIYCDSEPSWHHPQCNLTTRYLPSHQFFTPFSISNVSHMQLGRSHGYFQGIFPSQTILIAKELQAFVCIIYVVLGCLCIKSCMK